MLTEKSGTHNNFTLEQYDYMYSNVGFVEFLCTYFSTYCTINQTLSAKIDDNRSRNNLYLSLRIILANFSGLIKSVDEVINNLSYSYCKTEKAYQGEMRGSLNIRKYVQEVAKGSIQKTFHCSIKRKTYYNPENLYIVYILQEILKWFRELEDFFETIEFPKKEISEELNILSGYQRILKEYVSKPFFEECRAGLITIRRKYGSKLPNDHYELFERRIRQGKIRNVGSYQRVLDWYSRFDDITKLTNVSEETLKMLRYDSEIFADRIFELWNLFWIKETLVTEYGCLVEKECGITSSSDECKFVLKTYKGDTLKIYYQKGAGLYWDEEYERAWKYVDSNGKEGLRGIPDISIEYISNENLLVMIDVKNRLKEKRRSSEEIYKMIGYYANFSSVIEHKYSSMLQKQAVLIVRNDFGSFEEELVDLEEKHKIKVLSVSPNTNEVLNKEQFKKLCNDILNSKGIDGTVSSVLSRYQSVLKQEDSVSKGMQDVEEVYRVSRKNHEYIEALFNEQSLQEKLELHKVELEKNYFPHVWSFMPEDVKKILAMAECLYSGMSDCENVDCAPICLEYCRALEVQINELILKPFIKTHDIEKLSRVNKFYNKMKEERDMTLGECMYFFEKCNHNQYPMVELKKHISLTLKNGANFMDKGVGILRLINEQIRRRSAHTEVLSYDELIVARQRILGIGFERMFYLLLDER